MNYPQYNLNGKYPGNTYQLITLYANESSSLVTGDGNVLTQSINITSSFAQSASFSTTSSFANSSSAAGITGQITAQVQEWSPTYNQVTSSYPLATPQGILAYVTDAGSLRIGNGIVLGGAPAGIRYWNTLQTANLADSKGGELAMVNQNTPPPDQIGNGGTLNSSSIILYVNTTASNNDPSTWMPLLSITGIGGYKYNSVNGLNNTITIAEPNAYDPLISIVFSKTGSMFSSILTPAGRPTTITSLISIICGNGGNSISGSSGDAGGGNGGDVQLINCTLGNGGNSFDTSSQAGSAGNIQLFTLLTGNGGDASGISFGGSGGDTLNIISNGGNGGNATGSGAMGGSGGSGGNIIFFAGQGGNASGSNSTGGQGGNAGVISMGGGNALGIINGGNAGTITTDASGSYKGGDINTYVTTPRPGGTITTFEDTYVTCTLFTVTASVGPSNTVTETNFWTSSTVQGLNNTDVIVPYVIDHVGRAIRVKTQGYISSSGASSLRLRLYLGSAVIWDSTAITASIVATNQPWIYSGQFTFGNISTATKSGSVSGQGQFTYYTSLSSSVAFGGTANTSTIGCNTTASNEIRLTAQWGTAAAANVIKITDGIVELVN